MTKHKPFHLVLLKIEDYDFTVEEKYIVRTEEEVQNFKSDEYEARRIDNFDADFMTLDIRENVSVDDVLEHITVAELVEAAPELKEKIVSALLEYNGGFGVEYEE